MSNDRKTERNGSKRVRKKVFSAITGVIVSFMYVAGSQLDRYDTLDLLDKLFYIKWLAGSGISFALICLIWGYVGL